MDGTDGETWSGIAAWYDRLVTEGSGAHLLATATTLSLVPAGGWGRVLDIACGQGLATRAVAAAGAHSVTGIDATPEMVELARARHDPAVPAAGYRVDDAQVLGTVADAGIDTVTCQLALMDIPDLAATLAAVRRVLVPGGSFVFVIGHPAFLAPHASTVTGDGGRPGRFVADYLGDRFWRSENPEGVRRVGNHHRTLATYLNELTQHGYVLDHVTEPAATGPLAEQQPVYRNVPIFLGARVRRA